LCRPTRWWRSRRRDQLVRTKDRKGDHTQERLKQLNTAIERALAQLDSLPSDDELDVDDVATVRAGAEHLAMRLRKIEKRLGTGEEEMG
jgi:hypothetical protein